MTGKTRKQRLYDRNRAKEMADRNKSRAAQQRLDARNRAKERADRRKRLDDRNQAKSLADRDELRADVLDSARTLLREINGPGRPGPQPLAVCEASIAWYDDIWGSQGTSQCHVLNELR